MLLSVLSNEGSELLLLLRRISTRCTYGHPSAMDKKSGTTVANSGEKGKLAVAAWKLEVVDEHDVLYTHMPPSHINSHLITSKTRRVWSLPRRRRKPTRVNIYYYHTLEDGPSTERTVPLLSKCTACKSMHAIPPPKARGHSLRESTHGWLTNDTPIHLT